MPVRWASCHHRRRARIERILVELAIVTVSVSLVSRILFHGVQTDEMDIQRIDPARRLAATSPLPRPPWSRWISLHQEARGIYQPRYQGHQE